MTPLEGERPDVIPASHGSQTSASLFRVSRLRWLLIVAGIVLAVGLGEIGMRRAGYTPWRTSAKRFEPALHEFDPELGWRNKEGSYAVGPYSYKDPAVQVTMWSHGRRATGPTIVERPRRAVIVGCSYSQGWAVTDTETYAWRLQERFPGVEFINYGTAGYNTLQCLLALERHYAEVGGADLVVYGLVSVHGERNLGEASWLKTLAVGAARQHVWMPWADLDAGSHLVRHGLARYPQWPLCGVSAVVARAQDVWSHLDHPERKSEREEVTWRLLLEIERTAREHGSQFLVAVLGWQPGIAPYLQRLESAHVGDHSIRYLHCEEPPAPDLLVVREGHPNGRMNAIWADRLEPVMRELLGRAEESASRR